MNLQARELRYFLALSETLSFTEAAKRCEISQPALTRAIQGLEEKLGGRALIHREKGHTHLSPLGLAMKPYFEAVLNELHSAKEEARAYREQQRQALRLGVLNTLEPTVFSRFLETQTAETDKLAIELHESTAPNLSEMLRRGDIDVAITSRSDLNQESPVVIPLFSERLMIALPSRHPLATGEPTSLQQAAGELFLPRLNCEYAAEVLRLIDKTGIEIAPTATPVSDEWVLSMVHCGSGFTLLPEYAHTPPGIVLSPMLEPQLIRKISLVVSTVHQQDLAVQQLLSAANAFNWPTSS